VGAPDALIASAIRDRGLAFVPTPDTLQELRAQGAGEATLEAVEEFIPLLDEARRQVPRILTALYRALNAGERTPLTAFVFKELLDDPRRLDGICAPFTYQAHYLESVREPQRRVFAARVHFLSLDLKERVYDLEFVPVNNAFMLRNVTVPRDALPPQVVQQAEDVARRFVYARCAGRDDVVSELVTPGLLRAVEFTRRGRERGWAALGECGSRRLDFSQGRVVDHFGVKVKVPVRGLSLYRTDILVGQVDDTWKVVRIETGKTVAEDPGIRSYTLQRFNLIQAGPADFPSSPASIRPAQDFQAVLDSATAKYRSGDFGEALRAVEHALASGATQSDFYGLAAASSFMLADFENARAYALRAIEAGGKASFPVRHRHYNLLLTPPYEMAVGELAISASGISFEAVECSHGFTEHPFLQFGEIRTREKGFLLRLEVPKGGGRRGYDFGDFHMRYTSATSFNYRRGREKAINTILDIITTVRALPARK
jgi:hypothetical protein